MAHKSRPPPVDDDLPDFDRAIPPFDLPPSEPPKQPGAFNPPLWILRGNRMPEKVECKEKRRKVEIPADATHWCHEGDQEWIPFYRARPAEAKPTRRSQPKRPRP